jgi:uncharacterized membrane protein (DUF2068 family)
MKEPSLRSNPALPAIVAELYVKPLERLETNIYDSLQQIYRSAFGIPAVAIAIVGLVQTRGLTRQTRDLLYVGLVLLAVVLITFSVRQMLEISVLGAVRRAIEDYADGEGILPPGLFSWERGPATEISGVIRLDGRRNLARYLEPLLAGSLVASIGGYGLWQLQRFGVWTGWFVTTAILASGGIGVLIFGFHYIPGAERRSFEWMAEQLRSGRNVEK